MGKQRELVFLFNLVSLSAFLAGILTVEASSHHIHNRLHHCRRRVGLSKLFVFGDSYVDTGNDLKSGASSWKEPYGITFPGKPAGRFSDGRVLTDYIGGGGLPPQDPPEDSGFLKKSYHPNMKI